MYTPQRHVPRSAYILNGDGRNIFAAGSDDKLLDAAGDVEKAILVDAPNVARVKPAIFVDGLTRLLVIKEVATASGKRQLRKALARRG
jgi:hypothetical protein